jgi:lipopolysaccharide assembly outer membrane protein LptD (OstA)
VRYTTGLLFSVSILVLLLSAPGPAAGQEDLRPPSSEQPAPETGPGPEETVPETGPEPDETATDGPEGPPSEAEDATAPEPDDDGITAEETIPEDIRTASFYELSVWLERLGLSTRGGRTELERRLFEYYGLEYEPRREEDGRQEIIIESALESEYFELEEIGQQYVRLRGGVTLQMEDAEEGVIHRISADELIFNRQTEALTARGNIEYTMDRGTSTERFSGEHLTIYLDDWESVFIEGTSTRERTIGGRALDFQYSGEYITRSPDDIVTLKDGTITSSQADPPHYRIRARKIWVLGPGEWGLQGGSLYVGRVPVLYLPFFFRPGDKLFFNPVVGVKTRAGAFIQTTTYLVGQKEQEETQVSVLQLAGDAGEDVPREIDGLFLRPVEDSESADVTDNSLKLLADVYTTLGAYIGLEGDFSDLSFADTLQGAMGIGASKNIYARGPLLYTDRYVEDDGTTSVSWNTTQLGDTRLPFRYNFSLEQGIRRSGLSLDTTFEWFSDPFVLQDFGDRSETMDWLSVVDPEEQVAEETGIEKSDLEWSAIMGYDPDLPGLEPWVERLSLSRLEVSARWLSRTIPDGELPPEIASADRSPESEFYFPESLVLPSIGLSASGTLVEGEVGQRQPDRPTEDEEGADRNQANETDGEAPEEDAGPPPPLKPPWDQPGEETEPEMDLGGGEVRPPEIRGDMQGIVTRVPLAYELGYTLRPTLRVDNEFLDQEWELPEQVDFEYEYSTLTTNNTLTGGYRLDFFDRLFEIDGTARGNGKYRELYNEWDPDDPGIENLRLDSFNYNSLTAENDVTARTYPVQENAYIGDSNLSYTLNATYFRRVYDGQDAFDDPIYKNEFIDWTTEYVSSHNVAGDLRVDYWNATQSLRVVGNLPPLDNRYNGTLTLVTGPLTSRVQASALRENDEWTYDPLRVTETLSLGDDVTLRERFVYDIEEDRVDSSETSLQLWWLTGNYRAEYTSGYEFDPESRTFEERENEAFRPVEAAAGVNIDYQTDPLWKQRIAFGVGVDSDLRMDLQRFTQSSLDFRFSLSASVHEFLDLSVSSTSSNGLVYRYIPSLADRVGVEPKNPIADLGRSLNFFDIDDRRSSDFNLKRVSVRATHYLGDWVLNFEYSGLPEQVEGDDGRDRFEWRREFAIFLEWLPIPELNSDIEITDEEGVTYSRR